MDRYLFTEEEVQVLLSKLDSLNEEQLEEIEEALNDYEESMNALADKYSTLMEPDLAKLEASENPDDVAYAKSVREKLAGLKSESVD